MLDRKSTRLNSSHTEIYTLSLHDALPILSVFLDRLCCRLRVFERVVLDWRRGCEICVVMRYHARSEEHTSELQSHRDLHSFPTRRSSDLERVLGSTLLSVASFRARRFRLASSVRDLRGDALPC